METSNIAEHFTPLDRSVLEGDDAYSEYFSYLLFGLNQMIDSLENYQGEEPYEKKVISSLMQKFLNSVEVLSLKYAHNETHPLLIDLTESGFPNHLEFRRLADDLDQKEKMLSKGRSVETLKTLILEHMLRKKSKPTKLLKEISKRAFYETIDHESLFTEYTAGTLKKLSKKTHLGPKRYLYYWGAFDSVTNRPYVYMLVFDYDVEEEKNSELINNAFLKERIRKLTHNTAPLKVMISDIDALSNGLMPKVLKRIDVGPVFGKYSKDEHPFSNFLKEKFDAEDFIFKYNAEVIFSVGEHRSKSFLSKGELRQIFYIDDSNKECMEKMISKLNKYLITNHHVWQYMNEHHKDTLSELAVQPYIYSTSEHGK